jgi:hypothetical protein
VESARDLQLYGQADKRVQFECPTYFRLIVGEKSAKRFLLQTMPGKPHSSDPLKHWKAAAWSPEMPGNGRCVGDGGSIEKSLDPRQPGPSTRDRMPR